MSYMFWSTIFPIKNKQSELNMKTMIIILNKKCNKTFSIQILDLLISSINLFYVTFLSNLIFNNIKPNPSFELEKY